MLNDIQLPSLDDIIQIPSSQIAEFRTKGHTLIKSVLHSDEVPAYREVINEAAY